MSDRNRLSLKCRACEHDDQPTQRVLLGFALIAYDDMLEWSDFVKDAPPANERCWVRSDTQPCVGEHRIVNAQCPFNFKIGDRFWVLYRPALSSLNGWEDSPNEIELSALVKVRFVRTLSHGDYNAWVKVRVEDVLPLGQICDRFPARVIKRKDLWPQWGAFAEHPGCTCGDFSLYSWNDQGDVGGWYVTYTDPSHVTHVILYNEWYSHHDDIYCGNIV